MAFKMICLVFLGVLHAEHATAESEEVMKTGKAMSKFMHTGQIPRSVDRYTAARASSPFIVQSDLIVQSAILKTLANDMQTRRQEMQRLRASIQKMPQINDQFAFAPAASLNWLAVFVASIGLAALVGVAGVKKYSSHGQHGSEPKFDSQISLVPQRACPIVASAVDDESRSEDVDGSMLSRRQAIGSATLVAVLTQQPLMASAKYGDMAKFEGTTSQFAAGDPNNECLFATPGSGVCQVYKSSQPALWDAPDLAGAKEKLLKAVARLNDLDSQIAQKKWSEIMSRLTLSADLKETLKFLTKDQPESAKLAKKVLQDLMDVQLAAQGKDQKKSSAVFVKYTTDISRLLAELEGQR